MPESEPANRGTYLGIFLVALATVMFEILLTRIFSVTIWYHFAFVAVSVAMFGMTAGALVVYLAPRRFPTGRLGARLAGSALLFAVTAILAFWGHLGIPLRPEGSIGDVGLLVCTYILFTVPFVFSGICVCLVLTRFPRRVSGLYAADLAGAALGCVVLRYALGITDGPTAVFLVALLATAGAYAFARGAAHRRLAKACSVLGSLLAVFVVANTLLTNWQMPLIRLRWVKGAVEGILLYEKWNSFSRITVTGRPDLPQSPTGWGLSPACPADLRVRELRLVIDGAATTRLIAFDGDLAEVEHLRYDVTNVAHHLRSGASVLAIGSGGGRDILSALVFRQKSVLGVEINEDITAALNGPFGDFTGHLDRIPHVRFVTDEARSYIARSTESFDIIQISLIDTWAATAAGAFVLTENSLYTVEAWQILLDHLTPGGILTVSRWYTGERPGEMYRLTTLAREALRRRGIATPRACLAIVRCDRVGTLLVSPQPLSGRDLDTLERVAGAMRFELVLTPRTAADPVFATLASAEDIAPFLASFPLNISPPTDDSPFFFQMLRLRDVLRPGLTQQGVVTFNQKAVVVLGVLLATVLVLTFLCIAVPLLLTTGRTSLRGAAPHFVFFAAIGLGFMLIEVSQMQRLIVFLGHPTYGLSVVLFALLLSSGLGSYTTGKATTSRAALGRLGALLVALVAFGAATPAVASACQSAATPVRIGVAVAVLFPLGFLMGMPFPLGMRAAAQRTAGLTPWLWGLNGAASVCASVLAVAIALSFGISASYWCGAASYFLAAAALVWASRRAERTAQP
jgi:predicted membrane-bound spermidine synthase